MGVKAVLACLLCFLSLGPAAGRDVTLGLIKLLSIRGNWAGPDRAKYAACAIMAINHMNNRDPVLVSDVANLPADFNISYMLADSELTPSVAVQHAHDFVSKGADALIGPIMSASAGPASLISGISKIPLLAYVSTAPTLSDKTTYPYFARTCMSDLKLIENIVKVCKEMGWTTISVLYQNDQWGKGIAEAINTAGGQLDVKVLPSQQFVALDVDSMKSAVNAAASYGGRVFVFALHSGHEHLFFAGEDAGIMGPGYVWLNAGGSTPPHELVMESSDPERMARVIEGHMVVSDDSMYKGKEPFIDAMAAQDVEDLYHPVMRDKEAALAVLKDGAGTGICGYVYDATIAAGLALAHANLTDDGTIDREHVLDLIRHTNFEGATGHVELDPANGDRRPEGITMVVRMYKPTGASVESGEPTLVSDVVGTLEGGAIQLVADPYWSGGSTSWEDVPSDGFQCESGWALSSETLKCEACPAGTAQHGAACIPCDLGRFAPEPGTVACPKCTDGYANETGLEECHACPHNTYRPAGTAGTSIMECVCIPGTYSRAGPGTPCDECPAGAACEGGTMPPYPQPGFWGEQECAAYGGELECPQWFEFMECMHADCTGGSAFACAAGRAGRLCRETAEGWYNVGRIVFLECKDGGAAYAFLGIVGVIVAWTVIVMGSIEHASIDVLTQFCLVNAMIAQYGLKWHSNLNGLNVFLKIANFDVDFVSPGCFGEWRPAHSFFLQLFLPLLVTVLYVLFLITYRAITKCTTGHSLKANAIKTFVALTITVYHTALYKSFSNFRCDLYPDGREYLLLHPDIECWKSEHISMVVVGCMYIVLGGFGVPAWLWHRVCVHRRDGTLGDNEIDFTYGWQHRRYTMQYKNWWAVVCFRRFAVSLIAALIPWSMVQAMATVFIITALLTAQVMVRPHASARIDLLEFFSKVMTNLYVLGGMLMYGSITAKAQGRVCAEDASGVDLLFCSAELEVKEGLSVFSLACMILTLVFSGFLAFTLAWDDHNAFIASRLLARFHQLGSTKKAVEHEEQLDYSSLGHILNSVPVLKYIHAVDSKAPTSAEDMESGEEKRATLSAEEFAELEQGLSELARHFSSSKSVRAEILSKICTTPGVLEWVCVEDAGRESMLRFVNGLADFLRREKRVLQHTRSASAGSPALKSGLRLLKRNSSDQSFSSEPRARRGSLMLSVMDLTMQATRTDAKHKQAMFPVSDLVKKEHLGTATYYLLTCSERNRQSFTKLLDAILASSGSSEPVSVCDFRRSNSLSEAPALGVLREASTATAKHRKLSLDDYQGEHCPPSPPSRSRSRTANPRAQARKLSQRAASSGSAELHVQATLVTPRDLDLPPTDLDDDAGGLPSSSLTRFGSSSSSSIAPPVPPAGSSDGVVQSAEPPRHLEA